MFWDTYKAICKESVPEHYDSTCKFSVDCKNNIEYLQ